MKFIFVSEVLQQGSSDDLQAGSSPNLRIWYHVASVFSYPPPLAHHSAPTSPRPKAKGLFRGLHRGIARTLHKRCCAGARAWFQGCTLCRSPSLPSQDLALVLGLVCLSLCLCLLFLEQVQEVEELVQGLVGEVLLALEVQLGESPKVLAGSLPQQGPRVSASTSPKPYWFDALQAARRPGLPLQGPPHGGCRCAPIEPSPGALPIAKPPGPAIVPPEGDLQQLWTSQGLEARAHHKPGGSLQW